MTEARAELLLSAGIAAALKWNIREQPQRVLRVPLDMHYYTLPFPTETIPLEKFATEPGEYVYLGYSAQHRTLLYRLARESEHKAQESNDD